MIYILISSIFDLELLFTSWFIRFRHKSAMSLAVEQEVSAVRTGKSVLYASRNPFSEMVEFLFTYSSTTTFVD
jgi:hypothetical protein